MHGKWMCAVILLICFSSSLLCQSPDNSTVERKLTIGVNFFYYHPNIGDINSGFTRMENSLGLRTWSDFKIYYLALPTIMYEINPKMLVALEGGGSFVARVRQESKSFYGIWMIGGKYYYMPKSWTNPPVELWVLGGAGFIEAEFFRSYGNDVGISAVGRKLYIDGGAELRVKLSKRLDANVDVRYLFVPSIFFGNFPSTLKLNSLTAGIGFSYSM